MKNATEVNYDELIKEQKTTKPIIEDIIGKFLEGETLQNAMDFIAFLRENNMNPRWHSANSWRVTGKGKGICRIDLGGLKHAWMQHIKIGDWQISDLEGLERKYFDEFVASDELKVFVWSNVKSCTRCSCCGPRQWTYIGKTFDECCGMRIINPDAKAVELAKKLIEANKKYIYEKM